MTSFLTSADVGLLHWLYSMRSLEGVYAFLAVSELGTIWTLAGLTICSFLLLLYFRRIAYAAGLLASSSLAGLTVLLLKPHIGLARPDGYYQAYLESGMSFPSGHATGSTAFYGFLAYIALREMRTDRGRIVAGLLFLLIFLICLSRLYLGVHYLSDVLAGIALGALCDFVGIAVMHITTRYWR